jgi:protein-disulfide isomerase
MSDSKPAKPFQWRSYFEICVSTALLFAAVTMIWKALAGSSVAPGTPAAAAPPPAQLQSLDGLQMKGAATAKVAMIEYADFQCQYCASFVLDTFPELDQKYVKTGKVLFAFRHLPLAQIHPVATMAAKAARCATTSDQFWSIHDGLFRSQARLDAASVTELATTAGVSPAAFAQCVSPTSAVSLAGKADVDKANELGIKSTPVFMFGVIEAGGVRVRSVVSGTRPASEFSAILDRLLGVG